MTDRLHPTQVPRSLPRGRAHLPREVVLVSQRARLIEATVETMATKGYRASTVADIIRTARVSRSTFYEQFRDKEEAFIAAYEETATAHFEYVVAATEGAPSAVRCLQVGVRAYLELLANEPAYARVSLIEVLAAGPAASASRDSVNHRYATLLTEWHTRVRAEDALVPAMPEETFDAAVGGVGDLVATSVRNGATEELPRLAGVIVTFLLNAGAVPAGRELAAALSASRARRA